MNKLILCLLTVFAAVSISAADNKPTCSQESCASNPDCQCWCSAKCGFREKTAEDNPQYVENDPNGKGCYCKKWDRDLYKDNCIEGKDIKQPAGSK